MYRVEKVLNHNALIGIPENTTQEYLIMGKRGEHYSIGLAPEFIELPRAVTDE